MKIEIMYLRTADNERDVDIPIKWMTVIMHPVKRSDKILPIV